MLVDSSCREISGYDGEAFSCLDHLSPIARIAENKRALFSARDYTIVTCTRARMTAH